MTDTATDTAKVAAHYAHDSLIDAIAGALARVGRASDTATVDELGPVDEFHIGGREATLEFVGQLGLRPGDAVLDVGCGIGGPARVVAARFGCAVSGIDLSSDFIDAAETLSGWVGLTGQVEFCQGSALDMPFADGSFAAAYMLHVGMNIADKAALARAVARVLAPGGTFGIYDVMLTGDPNLVFPVPWAAGPETSAVATPEDYRAALTTAGFEIVSERNRRDFALDFFHKMRARAQAAGGPPALGLHIVMGPDAPAKIANMIANIDAGRIAPVEIVARRA